jgi:DNA-binding MarR family transcriptional regulator
MGPVLFALFEADDRSIKEIGARVQLSSSTLTGVLAKMEQAELIERRRDARDGRVVRVRLTPLARTLEPRCRDALKSFDAIIRTGLSDAEVEQVKELLRRFTETMRKNGRNNE